LYIDAYFCHGFGKTKKISDWHEWSLEEKIIKYNSKYLIEGESKWLKDKLLIFVTPMHNRMDNRVSIYSLLCFIKLVLVWYTS
jgi:transposase